MAAPTGIRITAGLVPRHDEILTSEAVVLAAELRDAGRGRAMF